MSKITKTLVDGTPVPDGKPLFIFDRELSGFVLKVTPSGKRIYQLRYRMGGREAAVTTYTLGRHGTPWTAELARKEAERLLLQVKNGIDPATAKKQKAIEDRSAVTLAIVVEDFLELHVRAKRKRRTTTEYEKLFRNVILPTLGQRRLKEIVPGDVERWHHGMKGTPYQANRALAVLSKFMNWATSRGYRSGDNPCKTVEKFKERPRKRYLSPVEIGAVGNAIRRLEESGDLAPHIAAYFRALMLSGMRKDELRLLEWRRVDLERGVIVLEDWDSKHEGDAKSGGRDVPINAPMRQIFTTLLRVEGNPFVFIGKRAGRPVVNVSKPWKRVLEAAGIEKARVHDLRHTAASVGVSAGATLLLIGGVLGHRSTQTTARYAHLAADPVRATSEAIGERVAAALDGKASADVVPLPVRRG